MSRLTSILELIAIFLFNQNTKITQFKSFIYIAIERINSKKHYTLDMYEY